MFISRSFPFDNVEDSFFVERIVFDAMLLHLVDIVFECAHLLFVSHYFDDVPTGYDAQLRVE